MGRPFAVIGFTMFVTLFFVGILGMTAAWCLLALAAVVLCVMLALKKYRKNATVLLALITCMLSVLLFGAVYRLEISPQKDYIGKEAQVRAVVLDYPEFEYERYYCEVKLKSINNSECKRQFRLRLCFSEDYGLEPGDEVALKGEMYELGSSSAFSKAHYLSKKMLLGMYSDKEPAVFKAAKGFHGIVCTFAQYRHKIVLALKKLLPSQNAALSAAVITGDKSNISSAVLESINKVGISHLICVSGLHLSILASAVILLLGKMQLGRKVRYITAAVFVFFFMALCGFTLSVVRAGIMFFVYILSQLLLAQADSRNSLGLAVMLILFNPFAALNIGFIFSFLSTLSIISFGSPIVALLKEKWQITKKAKWLKILFSLFEVFVISLCVNVCCLPFSVLIFQKTSFVGILANILILPIASLLLITGALCAGLSLLSGRVFSVFINPLAFVNSSLSAYVLSVVRLLERFRASSLYLRGNNVLFLLALVLLCAGFAALMFKTKRKVLFRFLACVCASLFVLTLLTPVLTKNQFCVIKTYSSGFGMCVSLQNKNEFILIDTALGDSSYKKVCDDISFSGSETISYLFLGSDNVNEAGNAQLLNRKYHIANLVCPKNSKIGETVFQNTDTLVQACKQTKLQTDSGIRAEYFSDKFTALLLEYNEVKVLVLNKSEADFSCLPESMRAFDYLIVKGQVQSSLVKSDINGIIEITPKQREEALSVSAYFTTADKRDIKIVIDNRCSKIGSENQWQR